MRSVASGRKAPSIMNNRLMLSCAIKISMNDVSSSVTVIPKSGCLSSMSDGMPIITKKGTKVCNRLLIEFRFFDKKCAR